MSSLLEQLENLVSPLLSQNSVELVDLTYQKEPAGWTLTFYLDKSGGFNLTDCEEWSRKLEGILEGNELLKHGYNLEISSPGLYRVLKKTADFKRFKGQRVHIRLYAPIEGQKNFHGILEETNDETIQILDENGKRIALQRQGIAKARLDPVINF